MGTRGKNSNRQVNKSLCFHGTHFLSSFRSTHSADRPHNIRSAEYRFVSYLLASATSDIRHALGPNQED